jgi:hypothetical protein
MKSGWLDTDSIYLVDALATLEIGFVPAGDAPVDVDLERKVVDLVAD